MLSTALASILRSGRTDFNARFIAARHIYPDLQADEFMEFLRTCVDDLVRAVEPVGPDRLGEVAVAAYDAALELIGQKLAGTGSRLPLIEEGWRRVLPRIATLVATAPGQLIPSVCNAIHQLAATPGARPTRWVELTERIGPQCADADTFLKLGQVAAWRAGLSHFRQGAIAAADGLPEALALAAVGARSTSTWADVREQLLSNPWFDPANPEKEIRLVAQAGSFRGFGGLFVEPPLVVSTGDQFLVRSGGECWLLIADVFGATFHRASCEEFQTAAQESHVPSNLRIKGSRLTFDGNGHERDFELPALGDLTSAAANETTLALTASLTHSVILFALR